MASPQISAKPDLGSLRIHDGQRSQSKMGKRIFYASTPVLIFAGIVAGAYALRSQKPVVEVATAAKPDAGGRQALLNASGYITPRRRATIAAKITGRVTGVFFDEGTRVAEGQLLATLDDLDVKRALDSAKADHDAAKAAIADYEVQLRNAQIALHRAEQLQKAGQQVTATLDAYPDKPIPSKVRTVIPTADRQKATVKVRITIIDLEKYNFILPDMGVKVAFLENEKPAAKDKSKDKGPQAVAFIPKGAVRSDANASFVFLIRDGKVERRAVNLGLDRGTDG